MLSSKNREFVNFSFHTKYTEEKYLVTFFLEKQDFSDNRNMDLRGFNSKISIFRMELVSDISVKML